VAVDVAVAVAEREQVVPRASPQSRDGSSQAGSHARHSSTTTATETATSTATVPGPRSFLASDRHRAEDPGPAGMLPARVDVPGGACPDRSRLRLILSAEIHDVARRPPTGRFLHGFLPCPLGQGGMGTELGTGKKLLRNRVSTSQRSDWIARPPNRNSGDTTETEGRGSNQALLLVHQASLGLKPRSPQPEV